MLPLEIMLLIRSYCDIDTKISLYKAGIPMQKTKQEFHIPQHDICSNFVHEPCLRLNIKDTNKWYNITKGNITTASFSYDINKRPNF